MERVAFNRLLYQQFNDRYRSFLKKNDQLVRGRNREEFIFTGKQDIGVAACTKKGREGGEPCN